MYKTVDDMLADVRQVWKNSYLYNKVGTPIHTMTTRIEAEFDKRLSANSSVASAGTVKLERASVAEAGAPLQTLKAIVKALMQHSLAGAFKKPVDHVALGVCSPSPPRPLPTTAPSPARDPRRAIDF